MKINELLNSPPPLLDFRGLKKGPIAETSHIYIPSSYAKIGGQKKFNLPEYP